jgi:hypothetical protein
MALSGPANAAARITVFKYCFFIQVLFDWFFFPVKGTKNFAFDSHED